MTGGCLQIYAVLILSKYLDCLRQQNTVFLLSNLTLHLHPIWMLTISETEVSRDDGCLKDFSPETEVNYGGNDVNCTLALFIKFARVDNNELCPGPLVRIRHREAPNVGAVGQICVYCGGVGNARLSEPTMDILSKNCLKCAGLLASKVIRYHTEQHSQLA